MAKKKKQTSEFAPRPIPPRPGTTNQEAKPTVPTGGTVSGSAGTAASSLPRPTRPTGFPTQTDSAVNTGKPTVNTGTATSVLPRPNRPTGFTPQTDKPTVNTGTATTVGGATTAQPQVTPMPVQPYTAPVVSGANSQEAYAALQQVRDPWAQYQQQLMDIYNTYVDREAFAYDPSQDALYRQYRDQYLTQGHNAMLDTMGQAAALTGGYGNTYAQNAGQQAYGAYLQQLGAAMPELYQLAWQRYQDGGQDILNRYEMMQDMAQGASDHYQDTLENGWQNVYYHQNAEAAQYDREVQAEQTAYDREQDAYDRELQAEQTAYDREQDAYDRELQAEQTAYDREQDAYDRELQAEQTAYDREQDAYDREVQAAQNAYEQQQDAYDREQQAVQNAYEQQQDAFAQLVALIAAGHHPTAQELEAAGMTQAQANALLTFHGHLNPPQSNTGSNSGNNSGNNSSNNSGSHVSQEEIIQVQEALDANPDGVWSPLSSVLAGGLTALQALDRLRNGVWGTPRAQKFLKEKGTRQQWQAHGKKSADYETTVEKWLADSGFFPGEIRWLRQQFLDN